jgi:hypothetical protein
MSVKLDVEAGTATVELPGEKGLTFVYDVRPVPPVEGWRSWAVERQDDPEAEHAHTVGRDGRRWRCTCDSFKYNPARWLAGCKHVRALKLALEALAKLTGD